MRSLRRAPKRSCYRTVGDVLEKRCPVCTQWLARTTENFCAGRNGLMDYRCRKCNSLVAVECRRRMRSMVRPPQDKFNDEGLRGIVWAPQC